MTTIRGKTHISSPVGTEAIPVETAALGDGYVTINDILTLSGSGLPVYNVKSSLYGAVGDGSTNDYTACQNAINACESAGGGIVFFPPGNFYIGTTGLSVTGQGVTLMGAGITATTISVPNAATYPAITLDGSAGSATNYETWYIYSGVFSMTIKKNGTAAGNTTAGLWVANYARPTVVDVDILHFGTGLYMSAVLYPVLERIRTWSWNSTASPTIGFHLDGTTALFSCYAHHCWAGDYMTHGSTGTSYGWLLNGTGGSGVTTNVLSDMYLDHVEGDNATYGLYIDGDSGVTGAVDVHISNGVFDGCANGIVINNFSNGCTIDLNSCWAGTYVSGTGTAVAGPGVTISNSQGVIIRALEMGESGNTAGIQFLSGAKNCTVSDCLFTGSYSAAMIYVANTCTNIAFTGNIFTMGSGSKLSLSGVTSVGVQNNVGVNDVTATWV